MKTAGDEKGFTLLELVIAITLVATIILIITGAVRLGYRSVNSGERKMENLERFRASLIILNAQIQSGAPLTYVQDGSKRVYFEGSRDYMRIATNYSIWGGRRGYVVVSYKIQLEENGTATMYASESMVGSTARRETKLLKDLDQIYFEYFYRDSIEEAGEWIDQWSDDTKTPEKVRIWLVSGRRQIMLIIPMRAQATEAQAMLDPAMREIAPQRYARLDKKGAGLKNPEVFG
jgi:prepilin-type N-terminal cleavage/methylation domain-containing protein